jgi:hypothetical protein
VVVRADAQTGTLQYVPQDMIDEVLPEVISADYIQCQGGDDTFIGHPIEMIKVDSPWPAVCKYCGLRYINKDMAANTADWSFLVGVRPTARRSSLLRALVFCSCAAAIRRVYRQPPFAALTRATIVLPLQVDPKGLPTYSGVPADSTRQPSSG